MENIQEQIRNVQPEDLIYYKLNEEDHLKLVFETPEQAIESCAQDEPETDALTPCGTEAGPCGGTDEIGQLCYTCPYYDSELDTRLDWNHENEEHNDEDIIID